MSTYQETLARLQAQMPNHSDMALERLARKIIIALEAQMKDEEIAQELTIEQPHYRNLRRIIQERDWNDRRIGAELDMLDQVARALGDDYPADTAQNNLSFTCALDYWRELQQRADADLVTAIAGLYLDNADHAAFGTDNAPEEHAWAEQAPIASAIRQLEEWIKNA